jgi:hypothetical protein
MELSCFEPSSFLAENAEAFRITQYRETWVSSLRSEASAARGFGIGVQRRKQNGTLICDVLKMTPNAIWRQALSALQPEHRLTNVGAKKHRR